MALNKTKVSSRIADSLAKTLNNILVVGPIFFQRYKINEIINKLLLTGNKFMTEMHLRQPGFTYSACDLFTINKEQMQKFKK